MEEAQLPDSLNPVTYPAKLWRLVNSPRFRSIYWNESGQGVLVDEQLFVREVLGAGPAADGKAGATDLFKTKSFASFIRQLNLYGFHKLEKEPLVSGSRRGGSSTAYLHCYHNPYFCRDRPDLLVHLKRLTSSRKAKLAATPELPSHLRQLPRTLLPGDLQLLPAMPGMANSSSEAGQGSGLPTVGQFPQPYHQESFFAYSYTPTSSQNHDASPAESLEQTPFPPILWQDSLELLPGRGASPTFPGTEVDFSGLQSFLTEVTYTLQPVASILPLQQEPQTIATSLPDCSSFTLPVQYSQVCYPTAALQCCSPPAHTDPLPGSARPAASTCTLCSVFPENNSAECESKTEESQFTSLEPVNMSVEETDSSVKPRCGKRRHSSDKNKPADLHLLEDRACKQGYVLKEETRE